MGDEIDAYLARPFGAGPYPGVVIIHHMPGWKKTEEELKRFGKTYEFHTYENAGHAFFAVDRPQYRVHAAIDGWKRVFAWFDKYPNSTNN
ncbi:MAG TPA: dienelactone hydrolase family protein [Burkholderiales bacterium]|nr:dienelactone hydrolase family protein [Burkholderiales bacterium]